MSSVINLVKRSGESAPYGYNFANDAVILSGDTIASIVSIVPTLISDPPGTPDTLVLGVATFLGTVVSVQISGGMDGCQYEIEFTIRTAGGYNRVGIGQLTIQDSN